ncbi:MAG TPA: phosphatase PAP2 family protein, partial [Chloroflexota bacterium]|nr:phosphatase PAP2 family protein [Chloroflexota bacterium]
MYTTQEPTRSERAVLATSGPATSRVQRGPLWPVLDIAGRLVALWLVFEGFLAVASRLGAAVMTPGAWLSTDVAAFRAINVFESGPLRGMLFALLNEPSLAYFAIIVLLLAYCVWRRRAALPAAALAVGIALALNATATHEMHEAGAAGRQRPFVAVPEARTPIQSCGGMGMVAVRGQSGPTAASCEESEPSAAQTLRGKDWRDIWPQFSTFPSGHVRETTALAILLAWFWRGSWPFGVLLVVTMAFSRLHLGAHYPTDVLAGLLVGLWSGGITVFSLDLLRRIFAALHRIPPVGRAWDCIFM